LRALRDAAQELEALEVDVLGVSVDDVVDIAAFRDELGLPFPLLSDEERRAAHAYGTLDGPFSLRADFVLDPEGIVRHVDERLRVAEHATSLLDRLRDLVRSPARAAGPYRTGRGAATRDFRPAKGPCRRIDTCPSRRTPRVV
jgi:peroxiredoxin